MNPLLYVSRGVLERLRSEVPENLVRYEKGTFKDFVNKDWNLPTSLHVDEKALQSLDAERTQKAEVDNSLRVWKALPDMTPAVATEARIWTRLAHVEALEFSRHRWLRTKAGKALRGDDAAKAVRTHFFGDSLGGYRDDHSVGRYWWNAFYAHRLATPQISVEKILTILLRADVRLNLLERSETASQRNLARAIFERLAKDKNIHQDEARFRKFMKNINLHGSGVLFEALPPDRVRELVDRCVPP